MKTVSMSRIFPDLSVSPDRQVSPAVPHFLVPFISFGSLTLWPVGAIAVFLPEGIVGLRKLKSIDQRSKSMELKLHRSTALVTFRFISINDRPHETQSKTDKNIHQKGCFITPVS